MKLDCGYQLKSGGAAVERERYTVWALTRLLILEVALLSVGHPVTQCAYWSLIDRAVHDQLFLPPQ